MWLILLSFVMGFVLDALWVINIDDVRDKRAIRAATISVLIYACTMFATILVIERCVFACLAYAAGNWIGTYLSVKRGDKV